MIHSPRQNTSNPENYIPSFRRRSLDISGFMKRLGRLASHLDKPVVRQLHVLYYLWESKHTPKRAKVTIIGALVYFLSPTDSTSDLLIPFGFSDDTAAIALVYSQMKSYLTEDIKEKTR